MRMRMRMTLRVLARILFIRYIHMYTNREELIKWIGRLIDFWSGVIRVAVGTFDSGTTLDTPWNGHDKNDPPGVDLGTSRG